MTARIVGSPRISSPPTAIAGSLIGSVDDSRAQPAPVGTAAFAGYVPSLCQGNPECRSDIACMCEGAGKSKLGLQSSVSEMNPFQSNFTKVMKGFLYAAVPQIGRIHPAPETQNSLSPLWQNSASQPRAKGQKLG